MHFQHLNCAGLYWRTFGSKMEPEPGESVSELSWHPEIVVLIRDVKVRLYVKKDGFLPDWQSQWAAGDVWLATRAEISAVIVSDKEKKAQLHSARIFGCFDLFWGRWACHDNYQ